MTEQTTVSYKLSEMTVDELVLVNQGLGHQIDKLRADRVHLGKLIARKLREQRVAALQAQMQELQAQIEAETPDTSVDAAAPGAVIEATATVS